jgi:hypothetical protein
MAARMLNQNDWIVRIKSGQLDQESGWPVDEVDNACRFRQTPMLCCKLDGRLKPARLL